MLLQAGTKINVEAFAGWTPLKAAIAYNAYPEIIEELVSHGATVDGGSDGSMLLSAAKMYCGHGVIDRHQKIPKHYKNEGELVLSNIRDQNWNHIAAEHSTKMQGGAVANMMSLLKFDATARIINKTDAETGRTALNYVESCRTTDSEFSGLIAALKAKGAKE